MIYVIMGVSGAGKTRVGKLLADRLTLPFYDADDFHPQRNVEKMESGQPLNDSDRKPWLEDLASHIQNWEEEGGAVLACSALKKKYRQLLKKKPESKVQFIYLKGTPELIDERLRQREGHYMPASLLNSQFDALEEPENAIVIPIDKEPSRIVEEIIEKISE
ncbi:MAG TPA: gluconokinase [Balneolaceae bacterium]|nr:gluconokinase [Balneolaceae bacterium]